MLGRHWVLSLIIVNLTLAGCSSDSDDQPDVGVTPDAGADAKPDAASPDTASPDAASPDAPAADSAPDASIAPSGVGRACKDYTACEPGDVCLDETKKLQMPGGYCTRRCTGAAGECGDDAICGKLFTSALCVETCQQDGDCRPGYVCEASFVDFKPAGGDKLCVPGDRAAKLGDPCADETACAPGVGVCLTDQQDGYCSAFCDPKGLDSCGSDGECIPRPDAPLGGLCARTCGQDSECRGGGGYACVDSFGGIKAQTTVCAPGTKGASHGDPCTLANDCAPGTGVCVDEALNGLPGGYCSMRCDGATTPDPCGDGAECVGFPGGFAFCLDSCAGSDECRPGYACLDHFENVPAAGAVCAPGQEQTDVPIGADCSDGSDCNAGTQACIPDSPISSVPGGYCSAICSIQDSLDCPAGGVCVGNQTAGNCFASCTTDADCAALRSPGSTGTYGCARRFASGQLVDGDGKVCTAVNAAAKIGDGCSDGADCNGELGRCIFDTDPAAAVRFPNGYCTIDCDPKATADTCGAGAICHDVSKGSSLGGSCVKTCAADADCRGAEGYSCQASSAGTDACLP